MPILRDISLTLEMDSILRRQEIGPHSNLRPELMAVFEELLASVGNLHLLEPAIAYEFHLIDEKCREQLSLPVNSDGDCLNLPPLLSKAEEIVAVVCTIGSRLEKKGKYYSKNGEPLRALILNGIGSAAVDSLAREACHLISRQASNRGYQISSPFSPGMPGLPISEQKYLLQLVPAGQIGVSLTSRLVMAPCKTISMVIGVGLDMPTWSHAEVCGGCHLKKSCLHRVITSHKGAVGRI